MQIQAKAQETSQNHLAARPMQILILDDSELDRQRLLRLCQDAGLVFDATETATIDTFMAALVSGDFDLVFIDYLLAGEDGLDAVDALAQMTNQTAASIMIAGEGRLDVAVEAMRRGCSDYLTKSAMTVDGLQKSVTTALERRMMAAALEDAREQRQHLERAMRKYANACSSEMKSLLSASLRRVRKLRGQTTEDNIRHDLGALEDCIDRMWDAMPDIDASLPQDNAPLLALAPARKH